ncbi:Uncharacterized [Syntrophomonas zehnderi OL-4]|uniref:Uncharacterized n=1 Tax=Syntrophomonas zehnderi OL-4 TaxID=690567 RepID=A0A0E4GCZ4_9FIRM|nr:hypothetical protein [Syntrophomonas zehnderi]CFX94016.1 Uncharacterized [Syntrophomonas zehnderi OL-4]
MDTSAKAKTPKHSFNPDVTNEMVNKYIEQKGCRTRCTVCGDSNWKLQQPLDGLPGAKATLPVALICTSCGAATQANYLQIRKYFVK